MHKQFHHVRGQTVCICFEQCECHHLVLFGYNLPYVYFYFSLKVPYTSTNNREPKKKEYNGQKITEKL